MDPVHGPPHRPSTWTTPNFQKVIAAVDIREIELDVTWSYVKRQTAKMKLLPSVFGSLNSRVKIFVFVANSRRHFSILM